MRSSPPVDEYYAELPALLKNPKKDGELRLFLFAISQGNFSFEKLFQPMSATWPKVKTPYSGMTIVEYAAYQGNWEFIINVIRNIHPVINQTKGKSAELMNAVAKAYANALFFATYQNNPEAVQAVLIVGIDPNTSFAPFGKHQGVQR